MYNTIDPNLKKELQECDQEYYSICRNMRKQRGYIVDWPLIDKAWDTCKKLHKFERRKSGELYICHPRSVMAELAKLRCKTSVLAAALLHDTMEDCNITYEQLRGTFSDEIAQIVCAVTAIKAEEKEADPHYASMSAAEKHTYLDRLTDAKLIASPYQREAFLVRFADRVHNLSTIKVQSPGKRLKKIQSTRAFLIPAAHKLGMHYFETVLSDYCMRYDEDDYSKNQSSQIQIQRDALTCVSGTGYSQFDQVLQEALEKQTIFSLSSFNPFAKLRGFSRNGEDEIIVSPRRVLLPYELKQQLDQGCAFERSCLDLFEIVLACNCNLQDALNNFIRFHQKFLVEEQIFLQYISADPNSLILRLTDNLENNYRIVLIPESRLETYFIGSPDHAKLTMINEESPSDALRPQITVYSYSPQKGYRKYDCVPYDATALDFAFIVSTSLAVTTKHARIHKWKGNKTLPFTEDEHFYPLHTKLSHEDVVFFDADYYPRRPNVESNQQSICHVTIDWFSYVNTENAVNCLIRYFKDKFPTGI